MVNLRQVFCAVWLLFICIIPRMLESSALWGKLTPGAHPVGFQTISKYDPSRPYKRKYDYNGKLQSGQRARPIQISVWYPAQSSGTQPSLLFEDYVHLTAREEVFGELSPADKEQSKAAFKARWAAQIPDEKLQPLYRTSMKAHLKAPPDGAKFPLVLIAQSVGMSYPYGNAVLAEFLASHGYVVATSPAMGAMQRQASFDPPGVLTQMQDLQMIISAIHDFPAVDQNKMALVGFSYGGMATSLLAMQNSDVDALITIDNAATNSFGYSVIFQHPLYEPHKLTVPVLNFATMEAAPDASDSFARSIRYADYRTVKLKGRAIDLSSIGSAAALVPGFAGAEQDAVTSPIHEIVCRYSLEFLNATLKKNSQALAFMKKTPQENGFATDLAAMEHRPALKTPPTEEQFVQLLQEKGVAFASNLYREIKDKDPDYNVFDPEPLLEIADKHLAEKKTKEAIEVLKLTAEAHDDYWLVHDALGRAYVAEGNNQMAVECFTRSLELNPENANATEMLRKLKSSNS